VIAEDFLTQTCKSLPLPLSSHYALIRALPTVANDLLEVNMLSIPDVPSFDEWVMLIQQNAAQASQLVIALKARHKKQGLFADASLELSIEDYDRAQRLFTTATTDPAQAERIDYIARLGRATLGPYPDREEWLTRIKDDPSFARAVYVALRTKEAMFGLQTPQAILMSIAAYDSAIEEQK
jgi:hypothetical protein